MKKYIISKINRIILFCFAALFILCHSLSAQRKNPLLEKVGKPYGEYHDTWMILQDSLFGENNEELLVLFAEAEAIDTSKEWELNRRIIETNVRFYESRRGGLVPSEEYTVEDYLRDLLKIAEEAEKEKHLSARMIALFNIAEAYRIYIHDYERAFAYFLEIDSRLQSVSLEEFPLQTRVYRELADLYYRFKEYDEAIPYYRRIAEDPGSRDNYYKEHYLSINGLGLCYRHKGEFERSDSCFMQLIDWTVDFPQFRSSIWKGIAGANIGQNHYLRGNYDEALRWLIPASKELITPPDYPFWASRMIVIAEIYLKKNQPDTAKKYIDLASSYRAQFRGLDKGSNLFDVQSRYYTYTGDRQKANAYMDSTLMAKDMENDAFSGLVLRRVEQQLRDADHKIHQQELNEEKIRSRAYQRIAIISMVALLTILSLLAVIITFYRRIRNAYRELVRRSQRWAGVELPEEPVSSDETEKNTNGTFAPAEENELRIMEEIEKIMLERELYKQHGLSLDMLATETGHTRHRISGILNRCTGKNFYTLINEYRVKEAIRIMSDNESKTLTIDAIALDSGFNDRHSFLRIFRKATGLSPTDFRKNVDSGVA